MSRDYGVALFPALGVWHPETSRLVTRFYGLPEGAQSGSASFGRGLTDVLNENGISGAPLERWLVRDSAEVAAVVGVLLDDIVRVVSEREPGPVVTLVWALDEVFVGFAGRPVAVVRRELEDACLRWEGPLDVDWRDAPF